MQTAPVADKPIGEMIQVRGEHLLEQVKRLVHEGNVRRIVVRQVDGDTVVEFPLTVGVVGAALAPMLVAVGALAALLAECTIEVERAGAPAGDDVPPPDL